MVIPWFVLSRMAVFVVWMLEGAIFTFALFPCLITRDFCDCRCFAIFDGLAVGSILSSQVTIHTQTRAPRSDNSIA